MSPETATLRDLYALVESVRSEMGDGFKDMDDRLRPIEEYITADKASNAAWANFKSGTLKVLGVVAAVVSAAVGAAAFIVTVLRLIV